MVNVVVNCKLNYNVHDNIKSQTNTHTHTHTHIYIYIEMDQLICSNSVSKYLGFTGYRG